MNFKLTAMGRYIGVDADYAARSMGRTEGQRTRVTQDTSVYMSLEVTLRVVRWSVPVRRGANWTRSSYSVQLQNTGRLPTSWSGGGLKFSSAEDFMSGSGDGSAVPASCPLDAL